jgi:hypothetical protein
MCLFECLSGRTFFGPSGTTTENHLIVAVIHCNKVFGVGSTETVDDPSTETKGSDLIGHAFECGASVGTVALIGFDPEFVERLRGVVVIP